MAKYKDSNFFKVPKKLLLNKKFINSNSSCKILILYLLSLRDTFKGGWFFQEPSRMSDFTNLSRMTLWRNLKELKILGIKFKVEGKKYYFNIDNLYKKFIEKKEII